MWNIGISNEPFAINSLDMSRTSRCGPDQKIAKMHNQCMSEKRHADA